MQKLKLALMILIVISFSTIAQEKIDKIPSIKGGIQELAKNINYPETAKKEGIMGKVFVKAVIDENGNVVETEVIKSVDKDLDAAAMNAVKLTKFEAGVMDGKNVKAEVTIPISFKLDDCDKKKS